MGGLQVFTLLADWTQTLHVALSALLWGLAVALATTSYYESRLAVPVIPAGPAPGGDPRGGRRHGSRSPEADPGSPVAPAGAARAARVRAYVALTKPRIIELLLITTIPAMVLATRDLPGMNLGEWLRLAFWTMLAGTLAAGSANAINQYLDRDIDLLMTRTRRRPLPAHDVTPENALVFGIVLGIISIALMAYLREPGLGIPDAAGDRVLRRRVHDPAQAVDAPEHRHRRGRRSTAAGHRLGRGHGQRRDPGPVPVRARLLLDPAPLLGPRPPHPQGLRGRPGADAAGGQGRARDGPPDRRCTRSCSWRSAIIFWPVAGMGPIYLASAVVLGAIFLWRAFVLWQQATSPDGSLAQAIRLYKFSITYLTLLFAAVAVDALVIGTAG